MRFPLDGDRSFRENLLFWIGRYIRHKLTSLSTRQLKDRERLLTILEELDRGIHSIEQLSDLAREARRRGLIGINTYYKPLEKLYHYLISLPIDSLKEIDEEMVADFLTLSTVGLSDATKRNYRIAMINFFKYIERQNRDGEKSHLFNIELKNWSGIRGRSGIKLPTYLTEKEIALFLKGLEDHPFRPRIAPRNRAIIKLILYTGIRVGEATHLRMGDLSRHGDSYLIRVTGKGNRDRIVLMKARPIERDLEEWLRVRSCSGEILFCNPHGKPLTQAYISQIVRDILKRCGIEKEKRGPHMLRHTFATLLYNKSKDLVLVQEALGHANLETARIYTHFDRERLEEAATIMENLREGER
ncbi:MAG: tyrosine-type recombinase/integrase [Epsilonproteobacteria bacterium]|nr:integrase [Campylobacterota bacterium]NPA56501.1 tyrosine-type recombinase/integrase [Campylobacterota bacterium]